MSDVDLSSDLLRGMKAISQFTGEGDERRCYYLATNGLIPGVFKRGNCWLGLKSVIREGYEKAARGAA